VKVENSKDLDSMYDIIF